MKTIKMKDYGLSIDTDEQCDNIFSTALEGLTTGSIKINFKGVIAITTYSAKSIFGRLYLKLGEEDFFKKITIEEASDDFKIIIQEGILSAIEESEE